MFDTKTNLFVIFAPGLGGNHLANVLSLSKQFHSRVNYDVYNSDSIKAHLPGVGVTNLQLPSIEKELSTLKNQSNVFCGHWLEYMQLKESSLIDCFPNRSFCIMQIPQRGSLLSNRFLKFNSWGTPWLFTEVSALYNSMKNIKKLFDEPSSTFAHVLPDLLSDQNIELVLNDISRQGISLDIDINVAQDLHNKWMDKNFTINNDLSTTSKKE